jgi:hypothetical protein
MIPSTCAELSTWTFCILGDEFFTSSPEEAYHPVVRLSRRCVERSRGAEGGRREMTRTRQERVSDMRPNHTLQWTATGCALGRATTCWVAGGCAAVKSTLQCHLPFLYGRGTLGCGRH